MINAFRLRDVRQARTAMLLLIASVVLLAAGFLGAYARLRWLALIVGGFAAVVLLRRPVLGLAAMVTVALVARVQIGTGTEVSLNLAALLVPAMMGLWLLIMVRHRDLHLPRSRTTMPLLLFLLSGLFSLVVGTATWDPAVPHSPNLILVQLTQWALFVFSAGAFWLMGSLVRDETWLKRLTFFYVILAGSLAILRVMPGTERLTSQFATFAVDRAPFWLLLAALVGGQLLFNRALSFRWRGFLLVVLGAVLYYTLILQRETLSNLAGVVPVAAVLAWMRWPRWRWVFIISAILLLLVFFPAIYQFAGGDTEWEQSGGSRLALIGRVVEVTMRNPVTGLGPAAYRWYARMKPLPYEGAYWLDPLVNSHNNYVDLFAHQGIVGLALFLWFSVEVIRLGWRLHGRFSEGFKGGYVGGMTAAWAGALVLMAYADWILPHVYNIGFPGFQASILVWMFLGGLVALEQISSQERSTGGSTDGF